MPNKDMRGIKNPSLYEKIKEQAAKRGLSGQALKTYAAKASNGLFKRRGRKKRGK